MTRLRSPLKQRGAVTERWQRWKDSQRLIVQKRAGWACEGCRSNMRPLEIAHLAGRNNKGVGEPWASSAELTAALCSSAYGVTGCHQKIDRALDPSLLNRLREDALERLVFHYPAPYPSGGEPLDAIREVIRYLEDAGWTYDFESHRIIKLAPVVEMERE